jgi:parvulin-like peptidyl-prolyl isomerase
MTTVMTLDAIAISSEEVIRQVRLSYQIPTVVKAIVARKIIVETAQTQSVEIEESELQQAADRFRRSKNLTSANTTWSWLQQHNLSLEEFEELIRLELLETKLANHLFSTQVEPFFVEHQLDYAKVIMYEVIFDDPDLALELFYAIEENEISFWEVARQYIQEPELRRSGGYRGVLSRQALKPEISAAVFDVNPPQVIRPIAIARKSHLIMVEEIFQPELDEALRSQILSQLFSQWLEQQVRQTPLDLSRL